MLGLIRVISAIVPLKRVYLFGACLGEERQELVL
jgi:hypothetical protein